MGGAPAGPVRGRGPSRRRVAFAVGLVATLTVAGLLATEYYFAPAPPPTGFRGPYIAVTLTVRSSGGAGVPPPSFWGSNLGPNTPITPTLASLLAASPVRYARWPGGAAGDGMNYSSGNVTNASGNVSPAQTTLAQFVGWCRSAGCHALLELPGEIDDPATAAYDVAYTERTLGFRPDLWSVGNEPALWTHFGSPWGMWGGPATGNASPASYADLVHRYVLAIRGVDPTARVLGLDGVGTGGFGETSWIRATLAENAPNVSGIGIHVYPSGTPAPAHANLGQFLLNLTGPRSLPARVAADRAAMTGSCAACAAQPLEVTEFNVGALAGAYLPYATGFPEVPAVATLLAQGLLLNLSGMYLSQLATPSAGAWMSATSSPHPLATLYTSLLPLLGPTVVDASLNATAPGLAVVATQNASGARTAVLVANTNLSQGFAVSLAFAGSGPAGTATAWTWDGTGPAPVVRALPAATVPVLVPPLSVALVRVNGTASAATILPPTTTPPSSLPPAGAPAAPSARSDPGGSAADPTPPRAGRSPPRTPRASRPPTRDGAG